MSIFYRAFMYLTGEALEEASSQYNTKEGRVNKRLGEIFSDGAVSALVQVAVWKEDTEAEVYVAYDLKTVDGNRIQIPEDICEAFGKAYLTIKVQNITYYEITAFDYRKGLDRADALTQPLRELLKSRLRIEYTNRWNNSSDYLVTDYVAEAKVKNKKTAKEELHRLLPDDKFSDEIDRIFDRKHPRKEYYGIPCHYKISVASDAVADDMIGLLVDCLYSNRRILSRRVTKLENIGDRMWDSDELKQMFEAAWGSVVEIVLNGDVATEDQYASRFHHTAEILTKHIKKNSGEVLFIFVENTAHPGFAKQLLGQLDEELDIVEIQEGVGNRKEALAYFKHMLSESNMEHYFDERDVVFERGKCYSVTQVRSEFNKWRKQRLKDRVYKAYDRQDIGLKTKKAKEKKGSAYEELKAMVGLTEVKDIVNDIISAYKVQKMRNEFYDFKDAISRHMIFSGSPGTAKTTVARLMTEIMKENGLLKTGAFVECGRADLVGKYVGWTAQIVKDKFKEAEGGVLFIDEAYSLVDDSNTYGAEAINTIVQEMENKRGDIIVIFAGYEDKMKQFLDQNEGLRSRIAFHVSFPDYSPEELMGIMEKILSDKKYHLDKGAEVKLSQIFESVYQSKEYGNGRFVRNLFEQAVSRQAARLMREEQGQINREMLFELRAEDFDTNIARQYMVKKEYRMGFVS